MLQNSMGIFPFLFSFTQNIEILFFEVLDTRGIRKSKQMGGSKNGLTVPMGVGRVDVAFHYVITHEAIDDINAFPLRCAENERMPEQIALIDESIGAHTLALPEIFEGIIGLPIATQKKTTLRNVDEITSPT